MTAVKEYFTAVTAIAVLGVFLTAVVKDKRINNVLQILTGILLLLVLMRPVAEWDVEAFATKAGDVWGDRLPISDYETLYNEKLRQQVKETTEEYIRKKAESLGAIVTVTVELSREGYPTPVGTKISGFLTAHQLSELKRYVQADLGIEEENQRWDIYE